MAKKICKNIIPIGAPAVGKGFGKKALEDEFGNSMFAISTGAIIRKLMATSSGFNSEYGGMVQRGDLLPDCVSIPLAHQAYEQGMAEGDYSILYWDGVFRTPGIIEFFSKKGIIPPEDTRVYLLNASKSTCAQRYEDRAQREKDRPDIHAFNHRFGVHKTHNPHAIKKMGKLGLPMIHIDANRDLKDQVIPDLIAHAKAFIKPVHVIPDTEDFTARKQRLSTLRPQPWVHQMKPTLATARPCSTR